MFLQKEKRKVHQIFLLNRIEPILAQPLLKQSERVYGERKFGSKTKRASGKIASVNHFRLDSGGIHLRVV